MLIVCSGPDTWHARRKKTELIEAFRKKFDSAGFSVESLEADIKAVANQLGTPSIFATKRMLVTEDLLHKTPIADIRLLARRLKADGEQTILLDLEQEPPAQKILDELAECNFHHYAYPLPSQRDFNQWIMRRAQELGVDKRTATQLAEKSNCDTWSAEQELMKLAANPRAEAQIMERDEDSIFNALEKYLENKKGWRDDLQQHAAEQVATTLLSQARAAVRVRDGATVGLHPFQVKKISSLNKKDFSIKLKKGIGSMLATRTGVATQNEYDALI